DDLWPPCDDFSRVSHLFGPFVINKCPGISLDCPLVTYLLQTKRINMNCLFAILVCLPVFTLGQPNWNFVEQALFRHFDSNADGHLTQAEVSSYLNTFDTDGDGQVSRQEYNAHITAQYSHDPITQRELHALFDQFDTNNNNHLSTSDYTALFADADDNANNQVSGQEFNR
ncbi:unnamed protein product, partial [Lymnaea stagnalis]